MDRVEQLDVALKEWDAVCRALEDGRQILLLRKGGIHETDGRFTIEHPRFLLFPTFLHQNREMLKASEHGVLTATNVEPEHVRISAMAQVTDVVELESRQQMHGLEDQHIWAPPLIDMRFAYRPDRPLYLLLVRVFRLAQAHTVRNTPAYAGCKSWIPLDTPIDISQVFTALPDEVYERRRAEIMRQLQEL